MTHSYSDKIECLECRKKVYILLPHLLKTHKMQPSDYLEKHCKEGQDPVSMLWSEKGLEKLKQEYPNGFVQTLDRPRKKVPLSDLFPEFGRKKGQILASEYEIFANPGSRTPERDPRFVYPEKTTLDILTGLAKAERNRIWLFGPSGVGKTMLIKHIAHILNYDLYIFNGDAYTTRADLIGRFMVKGGEVFFQEGPLVKAAKAGGLLLYNEIDTTSPAALNVIKPLLEDPSYLPIPELGDLIVYAKKTFRAIATANTGGLGDSTGHYINTSRQSQADKRRWNINIKLDYLPEHEELEVLNRYFKDIPNETLKKFIFVANKIRTAEKIKDQGIDKTMSLDELINWIENWLLTGYDFVESADISFLNPLETDTKEAISKFIRAVFV